MESKTQDLSEKGNRIKSVSCVAPASAATGTRYTVNVKLTCFCLMR